MEMNWVVLYFDKQEDAPPQGCRDQDGLGDFESQSDHD